MLRNLKVRSGLVAVIGLLLAAIAAASLLALNISQQSDNDLTELNSVSAEQAVPLYEAKISLLRARLALVAAYIDIATGTGGNAPAAIAAGESHLKNAVKELAHFNGVAKLTESGQRIAEKVSAAFDPYLLSITHLQKQLEKGSASGYVDEAEAMRRSDAVFNDATLAFFAHAKQRNAQINLTSDQRIDTAEMAVVLMLCGGLVLALASWIFLDRQVLRQLRNANEQFDRIARGDLSRPIVAPSNNEIGALIASLGRMQTSLARTVGAVRDGVHEINRGASEIAAGNTDLSARTEQQAASLEETAASMEEIAATVKQNAEYCRQAKALAAQTCADAREGDVVVNNAVDSITRIASNSNQISDIISVIDGIAFQTNILALNAAVEAARAGEQGRGFAVVAGEVRALAQRSASSARDVRGLIERSTKDVGDGVAQISQAGDMVRRILSSAHRVEEIMGEISAGSVEQAQGIEQISRAVAQMDEVTQQNAALVEQAAAASTSLDGQAKVLAQAVSVFQLPPSGPDTTAPLARRLSLAGV